ncbi:MAG: hypothetical protein EOP36_00340 [Rubrivivax sp.]|nr:MAG: hypothetical protein EOP36_00340 [Rubrivivax sp.]
MNAPRFGGSPTSSRRTTWAILLAVALLLAQWVGMLHRIDHAGGQVEAQAQSRAEGDYPNGSSAAHSCVVFDGVCLADLLPTALVDLLPARLAHGLPLAADFASWHGRFAGHFQPRAPPAA